MATMVTKIRKNIEVFFSQIIWGPNIKEVLGTSNFTSAHMNEKLVNKILIEYTSIHWRPHEK
jgi:hypothetical protein